MVKKTVNGKTTLFFYNLEDRLERVENQSGTIIAKYGYDPFGRRLWKEASGTKTYFMYADEGLIGEYTSTGSEIKTYGWNPGSTWGTDPLFMKKADEYYFYHNDHLGTPQKMTSVSGAVVWSAKYTSFGKAEVDSSSTIENNLRFPGQYYNAETGLHYNWHRYYDPTAGRYNRVDPVLSAFEIDQQILFILPALLKRNIQIQAYTYVLNNPINWTDIKGLAPNGCGPEGWKNKYVPENPFWIACFTPACNTHDNCYSKCGADKATCDKEFLTDMQVICYFDYGWANPIQKPPADLIAKQKACNLVAKSYYEAVKRFEEEPFKNAQTCCNP